MSNDLRRRDAEQLLRAIAEHHAVFHREEPLQEATRVAPHEAARRAGLEPGSRRCEAAVDYLEDQGVLEWEQSTHRAVGNPVFRMTWRGLKMLGEK